MAIGFDYGTANCSVAQMQNGMVKAVPLVGEDFYIPSSLCAPSRESVTEYLYRHMNILPEGNVSEGLLRSSINANRDEGFEVLESDVQFGKMAMAQYLEDPTEFYYVKSPKSFLGTLGLSPIRLAIFEDLVCAMMVNVKRSVESSLQREVNDAVIGRPVNFHNRGGERSNQQAISILDKAARRAGFKHVEYLYEPVAAGLDYEANLTSEKIVLVVDVGGGTTDCSMVKMGPNWVGKLDRSESMISHSGKFVGGNDLDIAITFKRLMAEFGKGTESKSGRPIPTMHYWDAMAINDVEAQRKFYAFDNYSELKQVATNAKAKDKVSRLLRVYEDTLSYSIVQQAENAKIALGTNSIHNTLIDLKSEILEIPVSVEEMENAIESPLKKITSLVEESVKQAGVMPDSIYITGGSARSPIIRNAIKSVLPNTPIASGDFDGSVTSGLARWADLCFK